MAASSSETRSFTVSGTPALEVRNAQGRIALTAGGAGQIVVRVTKSVRGAGLFGHADESDLEKVEVTFAQSGDTLRIGAEHKGLVNVRRNITVNLDITVPERVDAELSIAAGDVSLRGITGRITLYAAASNVTATDVIFTDGSRLEVNAGNATLHGALAPDASAELKVNAGQVQLTLPEATATRLEASVNVGTIEILGWPVPVLRSTVRQSASGDLREGASGTLRIEVNAGRITLRAA